MLGKWYIDVQALMIFLGLIHKLLEKEIWVLGLFKCTMIHSCSWVNPYTDIYVNKSTKESQELVKFTSFNRDQAILKLHSKK